MLNTFFLKRYFPGMCILLYLLCILLKRQCLWSESVCLWISNLSPTSSKHSSVVYFDRLIVCSATLGGKCHRLFSVVIITYLWIIAKSQCSIISSYWQVHRNGKYIQYLIWWQQNLILISNVALYHFEFWEKGLDKYA